MATIGGQQPQQQQQEVGASRLRGALQAGAQPRQVHQPNVYSPNINIGGGGGRRPPTEELNSVGQSILRGFESAQEEKEWNRRQNVLKANELEVSERMQANEAKQRQNTLMLAEVFNSRAAYAQATQEGNDQTTGLALRSIMQAADAGASPEELQALADKYYGSVAKITPESVLSGQKETAKKFGYDPADTSPEAKKVGAMLTDAETSMLAGQAGIKGTPGVTLSPHEMQTNTQAAWMVQSVKTALDKVVTDRGVAEFGAKVGGVVMKIAAMDSKVTTETDAMQTVLTGLDYESIRAAQEKGENFVSSTASRTTTVAGDFWKEEMPNLINQIKGVHAMSGDNAAIESAELNRVFNGAAAKFFVKYMAPLDGQDPEQVGMHSRNVGLILAGKAHEIPVEQRGVYANVMRSTTDALSKTYQNALLRAKAPDANIASRAIAGAENLLMGTPGGLTREEMSMAATGASLMVARINRAANTADVARMAQKAFAEQIAPINKMLMEGNVTLQTITELQSQYPMFDKSVNELLQQVVIDAEGRVTKMPENVINAIKAQIPFEHAFAGVPGSFKLDPHEGNAVTGNAVERREPFPTVGGPLDPLALDKPPPSLAQRHWGNLDDNMNVGAQAMQSPPTKKKVTKKGK